MGKKEANEIRMSGVLPSQGADPIPVGKIPDDGTQQIQYDNAINETTTIHTVTTGKTFYLSAALFSGQNLSGGNETVTFFVTNAADSIQYYFWITRVLNEEGFAVSASFLPPLEVPAGWKFKLTSAAANMKIYGTIHGYEV